MGWTILTTPWSFHMPQGVAMARVAACLLAMAAVALVPLGQARGQSDFTDDDVPEMEQAIASTAVEGYTATVVANNVVLRSGPGFGNYPTDKIARGKTVEVYRAGSGGWVGVRPLESSFSWVPAAAVERDPADPSLARVLETPVEAWIGSNVERVKRHASQVVLEPGEEVVVLAERARDASGGEVWLKIAPPAGEFRWVHSKNLSSKSPKELAAADARKEVARAKHLIEQGGANDPDELASSDWDDRAKAKPPTTKPVTNNHVGPRPAPSQPRALPAGLAGELADERDDRFMQDDAIEQAAFGDGLRRVRDRVRQGIFRQRPSQSAESPASETGVEIGRAPRTAAGHPTDDVVIDEYEIDAETGERIEFPTKEDRRPVDLSPEAIIPEAMRSRPAPRWVRGSDQADRPIPAETLRDDDRFASRDDFRPPGPRFDRDRLADADADERALTVSPAIERGIEDLDRELTMMAARDPRAWNMGALREHGERLLSRSKTPLERGRVRLVLDRIAAFESTAPEAGLDREPMIPAPPTTRRETPPVGTAARRPEAAGGFKPRTTPWNDGRDAKTVFDGVGRLMPVFDNVAKGLPPYQLVDEEGNFLRYVTPEPGVNLRRYERAQVGIYGTRGYVEALGKDHLTARSVVDMNQLRR